MKAARFHAAGDIRIEDLPEPSIGAPDEVLVAVHYCGICGTDLHEYLMGPIVTPVQPHPLTGATLPQTLGHEFSATVIEIGPGVRDVRVGDRVAIMPAIVCGRCHFCRRGLGHLCQLFAATGLSAATGGMGQFAVLKDYQVAVLPEAVSNLQGAVIEPACVAAYGVERAGVEGGDVVLVAGAGPIGMLTAMYAHATGAATVVIAEPNAHRARMAAALDLGPVLSPLDEGFKDGILELTDGIGVDLAVECSGSNGGLSACLESTRRRGSIVQTGLHTKPAVIDAMLLANNDLTLYGSWCWNLTDWPRIIRLVAAGMLPVEKVVTAEIPLDDVVSRGFDVLCDPNGDELKVLVKHG